MKANVSFGSSSIPETKYEQMTTIIDAERYNDAPEIIRRLSTADNRTNVCVILSSHMATHSERNKRNDEWR